MDPGKRLLVACLCATWCKTCTEFRVTFDRLASESAGVKFAWLDGEAPEEVAGLPEALAERSRTRA